MVSSLIGAPALVHAWSVIISVFPSSLMLTYLWPAQIVFLSLARTISASGAPAGFTPAVSVKHADAKGSIAPVAMLSVAIAFR